MSERPRLGDVVGQCDAGDRCVEGSRDLLHGFFKESITIGEHARQYHGKFHLNCSPDSAGEEE